MVIQPSQINSYMPVVIESIETSALNTNTQKNVILDTMLYYPTKSFQIFKNLLSNFEYNASATLTSLAQRSHLDRIPQEGASIETRNFAGSPLFTSFDLKSNILFDVVSTTSGNNKFYMNLTEGERLNLDIDKFGKIQRFLENIPQEVSSEQRQECVAEVLSKVLAYISPQAMESSIKIPDANGKLVEYQISKKWFKDSNLPYFLFTAPVEEKNAKAWLVIRGTDANIVGKSVTEEERASALKSIMADFVSKQGLATMPINNTISSIKEFLDQNPECQLTGHSLGGIIQHLAVKAASEGCSIGTVYAFNAPGVSKETKDLYDGLENKPTIKCYDKKGDFIPSAGRYLIGDHYRVIQGNSRSDVAHRELDFNKKCTLQLIDNDQEEGKFTRKIAENLRVLAGSIIGGIASFVGLINGKDYLQGFRSVDS